jgi:Flp pilus assembly pilin Flp
MAVTRQDLQNRWLLTQIKGVEAVRGLAARAVDAQRKFRDNERGQTPTEYLMIVGLMAVVIITVFVFYYWSNVKTAAQSWVSNVKQSVLGKNITK